MSTVVTVLLIVLLVFAIRLDDDEDGWCGGVYL